MSGKHRQLSLLLHLEERLLIERATEKRSYDSMYKTMCNAINEAKSLRSTAFIMSKLEERNYMGRAREMSNIDIAILEK